MAIAATLPIGNATNLTSPREGAFNLGSMTVVTDEIYIAFVHANMWDDSTGVPSSLTGPGLSFTLRDQTATIDSYSRHSVWTAKATSSGTAQAVITVPAGGWDGYVVTIVKLTGCKTTGTNGADCIRSGQIGKPTPGATPLNASLPGAMLSGNRALAFGGSFRGNLTPETCTCDYSTELYDGGVSLTDSGTYSMCGALYLSADHTDATATFTFTGGASAYGAIIVEIDADTATGIVGAGSIVLSASAQLGQGQPINGAGSIVLGASGQLNENNPVNGFGSIVLGASGQLNENNPIVGAGSIALAAAGQLRANSTLVGAGSIVLGASGQLNENNPIVGAGSIALAASGQLGQDQPINGAGSFALAASGQLSAASDSSIVGLGSIVLSASGQLNENNPIVGAGSIVLGASGQLQETQPINGAGSIVIGAAGQLNVASALIGAGSIALAAAGQIQSDGSIVGAGSIVLGASGQLNENNPIVGAGSIALDASGQLRTNSALVGAGSIALSANGQLGISGDGIVGVGSIVLGASGQLNENNPIVGAGSIGFNAFGQLNENNPIVGVGSIALSANGQLQVAVPIVGAGSIVLAALGQLRSATETEIVGVGSIVLGAAGQLQTNSPVSGVGSFALAAAGQLQTNNQLNGVGSIVLDAAGQLKQNSALVGVGSIGLAAAGQLILPSGLLNIIGSGSIFFAASGQLNLELPCCDTLYPHPLTRDEARGTLANRFGRIADKYRQLYTDFGLRSRRVFLVWTRWSGSERGEGHERLLAEVEILPTPRVSDASSISRRPYSAGVFPEGTQFVDQISIASFTEDMLKGHLIPNARLDPMTCAERNMQPDLGIGISVNGKFIERGSDKRIDFWYEIYEDGRGDFPPSRKRFRLFSEPARKEGALSWSIVLERSDESRDRSGNTQIGINDSEVPGNGFWLKGR